FPRPSHRHSRSLHSFPTRRSSDLFCNVSAFTLANEIVFQEIADFLGANRVLAPYLVFEFSQSSVRAMGPIEQECLARHSCSIGPDRKSTRLNSSHDQISYAVFCLK